MDKAWKPIALTGVAVGILSVGATLLILNLFPDVANVAGLHPRFVIEEPPKAPQASQNSPQPGRYIILWSPRVERNTFLLDTGTGRVWVLTSYPYLIGEPDAWAYMERLDNLDEMIAFEDKYGKKKSSTQSSIPHIPLPPDWKQYDASAKHEWCALQYDRPEQVKACELENSATAPKPPR